jgi:hypothetical protein
MNIQHEKTHTHTHTPHTHTLHCTAPGTPIPECTSECFVQEFWPDGTVTGHLTYVNVSEVGEIVCVVVCVCVWLCVCVCVSMCMCLYV